MTTKISAIIAQHLASQTRIIIPEVGTLLRRKESGEVVFMEMLKKSDGTLVNLVVNTLDVSPSKATEIVNGYTATIKQQLATQKKFILDGIGVLLVRIDGSIDFSFNPFAQSIPEPSRNFDVLEDEDAFTTAPTPRQPASPVAPKVAPQPQQPATPVVPKPAVASEPEPKPTPVAPAAPKPHTEPQPRKVIYCTEEEEEQPTERKSRIQSHHPRKKIDGITVVALVAVLLALLSLVWGILPSDDRVKVDVEPTEVIVNE